MAIRISTSSRGDTVVVDKSFQVSRRNDASGNVVRIEVDRILFPDIQARRLIPVGQEQVFGREPPVQKCSVNRFIDHFQAGRLADRRQRAFGRSHQPVFRIVVNENFQRNPGFVIDGYVTIRQQHFVPVFVREIESVVRNPIDFERIIMTCYQHDGNYFS